MSRIAVTTSGTLSDLHPTIAIALELRQRGHDVVFVTHEVYQSKLQALGFEFHAMRPDFTAMKDPQEMARMMDLKTGQESWYVSERTRIYAKCMRIYSLLPKVQTSSFRAKA